MTRLFDIVALAVVAVAFAALAYCSNCYSSKIDNLAEQYRQELINR